MGRIAFITGAGGNIGGETALAPAKDGCSAALVVFPASEQAGFITGQTYVCDGGRSLAMKGSD